MGSIGSEPRMLRRTVVHGFEVIYKREDILVSHRYSFQDCYLVPYLCRSYEVSLEFLPVCVSGTTDHVLSSCHHPFVDDFGCIVSSRVYMHAFLDYGI